MSTRSLHTHAHARWGWGGGGKTRKLLPTNMVLKEILFENIMYEKNARNTKLLPVFNKNLYDDFTNGV